MTAIPTDLLDLLERPLYARIPMWQEAACK